MNLPSPLLSNTLQALSTSKHLRADGGVERNSGESKRVNK